MPSLSQDNSDRMQEKPIFKICAPSNIMTSLHTFSPWTFLDGYTLDRIEEDQMGTRKHTKVTTSLPKQAGKVSIGHILYLKTTFLWHDPINLCQSIRCARRRTSCPRQKKSQRTNDEEFPRNTFNCIVKSEPKGTERKPTLKGANSGYEEEWIAL